MIYGLYLSASGVMASSYRQDVLANNLANSETIGFKRDLALFRQRPTAARENGRPNASDSIQEALGGGLYAEPTRVDRTQGEMEQTGGTHQDGARAAQQEIENAAFSGLQHARTGHPGPETGGANSLERGLQPVEIQVIQGNAGGADRERRFQLPGRPHQ